MMNNEILENLKKAIIEYNAEEAANLAKKAVEEKIGPVKRLDAEWMKTGKKDCIDYAKNRMDEIFSTHKPAPLTEDQDKEIERILREARKYYRERGLL